MSSRTVSINDTEIERGRGRANDSSTSRESSPLNTRKRGPTPASDNDVEDIVLPATALDDETPPPPERPLVREPVAFSSVTDRTNIPTYQASLLHSSSSQKKFLPGQDPSTAKGKKKRTKRIPPFSAQTGRFRLQTYAHSTNTQNNDQPLQPQQQGQGPYHSLYRANNSTTPTPIDPAPDNSTSQSSSSQPPSKRVRLITDDQVTPDILDTNFLSMPDPIPYPSGQQASSLSASDYRPQGPNERRPDNQPQASSSAPSSVQPNTSNAAQPANEDRNRNADPQRTSNSSTKRPGFYNRMITILIHDIRSGKLDRQLAEVSVPVKIADDPKDGFWTDAKDIILKLQASPSRIDGPAKVYTLRGKYRQYFLRVSPDNVDNFASANIGISADRTLDVVVETPLEMGVLPSAPRIPSELLASSPEVVDTSDLSDESLTGKNKETKAQKQKKRSTRKRQHSLSGDESSDLESEARSKHSRFKRTLQKKSKGSRGNGTIAMSVLDHLPSLKDRSDSMGLRTRYQKSFEQMRGYDSPSTDEDPSRLYDMMVRAVETIIQKQPDGLAYTTWRSGRLPDLIKACGFVQRLMNELVGELAPFRTKSHEIRQAHVLAALRIEQKMASEATEILKLLKLYGEDGTRCRDGRVIEMIARDDPNKPYKQLKQLLRLLRNIHEEWKRDHGALQSDTMGDVE